MCERDKRAYQKALFVFRRDLRLRDNTGLNEAARMSDAVVPCFIFDPRQTSSHPYFSDKAFEFMRSSLRDLAKQLNEAGGSLLLLKGRAEQVIRDLNRRGDFAAIFINKDYTPFSKKRDATTAADCQQQDVAFHCCSDALLHEPQEIVKDTGTPYTIFSYFLKKARMLPVRQVETAVPSNFIFDSDVNSKAPLAGSAVLRGGESSRTEGGRTKALELLRHLEQLENYERERDYPAKKATTGLSAHNKFGTCSIREVYRAIADRFGLEHRLITELYWRDFYYYIADYFPHVFGHAFHHKYDAMPWSNNVVLFSAWCNGMTGFPIIDAGMRQLNEMGFVPNRVRMLAASFLVKDLHIDWRWGERHFAQKLVDYDPSLNNGNWQWCASTGADAQPYFRTFNPWLQQKRYDPNCYYVKAWVPELRATPPEHIHSLGTATAPVPPGYPRMIANHAKESKRSQEMYRRIAKRT